MSLGFSLWRKWLMLPRKSSAGKGRPKARPPGWRWTRLFLEELEPRLAPTANISFTAPAGGSDLTLNVAQVDGAANLQLVDNSSATVIQSVLLSQDCVVNITGAAGASNLLTVDFSYGDAAPAEPISVTLNSGSPAAGATDQVTIAGSGPQYYQPQSFALQTDGGIIVTGALQTMGDINLTSMQQSSGAVALPGVIQASASTSITVNGGSLTGDNITLAAQSTINVDSQSINLFNGLIAIGAVNSTSSATVQVQSGALTASGNLSLTATSNTTTALAAAPAGVGTLASDAAVSTSTVGSTASVAVSGGSLSAAAGTANIAATNDVTVTTTADGSAGGAAAGALGGTVGVTVLSGDTSATISDSTVSASEVDVSATSNRTVTTLARATQGGAAPGNPTNTQGQQILTNYNAATPDGNVNVAGAVAVTSVKGDTTAGISGGSTTSSANPLTVTASATDNPTTTADATPATGVPATGVGAAVAIGQTSGNSIASLGGAASLTAPSVNIEGLMPASTFSVGATSGPSGAAVGVAGSLAIDVTGVNATAQVEPGSAVNVNDANVTLNAQSTTDSPVTALPATVAGQSVGVGGSIAINVPGAGERVAIENSAELDGANNLTVTVQGTHTTTTTSLAGAAGGTATAGAVSLAIPSGVTAAVIGTGPALTLGGGLSLTTDRTSAITTQVDSASAASGVAVGGSVGLTIASESATSSVGRAVTTGTDPALVQAQGNDTSNTTALASASGAAPDSTTANTLLGNLANFAAGQGWTPGVVTLPTAATPDGNYGVAGAIAVNIAGLDASAEVLPGASLQVAGSTVTVQAITTYADTALADGTAVNAATGVAGALAINVSTPSAQAIIAGSVSGVAVTVTATVSGQTDVTANSGQGSTDVGVAGALALNTPAASSTARVAAGSSVTTSTGNVTVQATTTITHDNATATGTAAGFAATGVGASVAMDIPSNKATAEASGTVTSANEVTVSANGTYPATALAEAGANGGIASAPALSLAVPTNTTMALIGAAAIISAGGAMLVQTVQQGKATSRSRADSAGTNVAVGMALAFGVGLDSDEAEVDGNVTHSSALTIETDLTGATQSLATSGSNGVETNGGPPNSIVQNVVSFGKAHGWLRADLQIPSAQTAQANMQAAAAAAINVDLTTGTATIASGAAVTTSSPLLVHTVSEVDASANADGTPTDGSTVGLGAALAINVARPQITASVAGSVSAPAITIKTEMGGDGTYTFGATATSGDGTSSVGAAGAVAINVGACQSEATVADGATLTLGGGMLLVNSAIVTANSAGALAATANPVLGIGLSFAANTAVNESHADLGAAVITGANAVTVEADGTNQVTTLANAGGKDAGGTGAAAVAAAFSGNQTIAEVLAGPTTLVLPGLLDIVANGNSTILTTADGKTAGTEAGVGASIAVGVNREIVTARLSRNSNASAVHIDANAESPTTTNASASTQGGDDLGESLDAYLTQVIGIIDPNANDPLRKIVEQGIAPTLNAIQNDVGVALPIAGVAATMGVTVSQPQTLAEIGDGTTVTAGSSGDVTVQTSVDSSPTATADGQVQNNLANGAMALAANFGGGSNRAAVDNNVTITSPTITIAPGGKPLTFVATANSGSGAIAAGAAGAIALNAGANTMQAQVGDGDQLTATGNVSITAQSTLNALTGAGGQVLSDVAGVGASVAVSVIQDETDASIGNSQVDAGKTIEVSAQGQQNLGGSAVNGSGSYLADVAGSINANTLVAKTQAFTGVGAQLDQNIPASAGQSIQIQAVDDTMVTGSAGLSSGASLIANVGAAVDAAAIQKDTLAYLGGKVNSGGNISVQASSDEEATSMSGTSGLGGVTDIAGSGGIDHLDVTTKAYVDSGANVTATGSIQIAADDHSESDLTAGTTNLAAGVTVGAAVAAGWNTKVTEAYIAGADSSRADPFNPGSTLGAAKVHADGKLPAIDADDGTFDITYATPASGNGKVNPFLSGIATTLAPVTSNPVVQAIGDLVSSLLQLLTVVDGPPVDPALSQQRIVTPHTTPFQGIAITATTRDYIADQTDGAGGGFGIAPELSGSAALVNGQTSAFIAAGAEATSSQSIRVAAGSDAYHLGIAGVESAEGLVSVGASGSLSFINNTTEAYVAGSATASDNVEILAHAEEDIVAVATGLKAQTESFSIDLAASFPVIAIDNITHAFVDAGGFVHALGNVLIAARDDTVTNAIAGQASLDTSNVGLGVGGSAAVTLITKDTEAYIGQNATVQADGTTPDTVTAYTGAAAAGDSFPLGFATETLHGLAVQAGSSEQVFDIAAGGQVSNGTQLDITGSLGFYVLRSSTSAYVDTGATVTASQVNVSAVNDLKTWDAAVNLFYSGQGSASVVGGVDVGLDRNSTTATIGGNVTTTGDVEVHALSRTLVDSFVGAAGGTSGGISLAASISLISIRGNFSPILGIIPLNFLNLDSGVGNVQDSLDAEISSLSSSAGDGIAGLLNKYAKGVSGGNGAADALSSAAPTTPASTAVTGSLDGLGTQAHISGGTVKAGGQVVVTGQEVINAHLDTSFTFDFNFGNGISLTNDRGILTTGGVAGGFIDSGAQVTASGGPITVSGDVENNQQIAASTAVNGTSNQVSAVIRGVNTTITPAITPGPKQQVAVGDTAGIVVGTPLVVDAGQSDQETVTVTAVDSSTITADFAQKHAAGTTLTLPQQTTVKAPGGDVNLTATSDTQAKYMALLPAYDAKLQTKSADTSLASTVDAHISADADVTGKNVNIRAKDTGTIFVLAIAMTLKTGSFGVGANLTTTEAGDTVKAYTDGSAVTATTGTIDLNATAVQNIQSYGIGAALATGGSFEGAGSYVSTDVANTIEAYITGGTVEAKGGVTVSAGDADGSSRTTITTLAGGAAGSLGSVAVGAAVTNNTLENTIQTYIDGAKVTSDTGDVNLNAVSNLNLTTVTLALAGADKFALGGSVTINTDRSKVESNIQDGAMVTGHGSVNVTASDTPTLNIVAGTLAGSTSVGVAAGVAINSIGDTVQAGVDNSSVTANTGNVQVLATYHADMTKLVVVGGAGASTAGVAGSVDVNSVANNVQASISNQSTVDAKDDVAVIAQTETDLTPIVGSVAIGGTFGLGGSVLLDEFSDKTQAFIDTNSTVHGAGNAPLNVPKADGSTDTQNASGVFVIATTNNPITEVTINGGVGGTVGISGTVDVDILGDTTTAYIDGATVNPAVDSGSDNAAQAVFVRAANNTTVDVTGGSASIAGTVAVGATSVTTLIHNSTQAYIKNNAQVAALGDIEVTANSQEAVNAVVISLAGSFVAGVAGQALVINLSSDTEAYIDGSTVNATDLKDANNGFLKVLANTNDQLGTGGSVGAIVAGAVGVGLGGGAGGSVIVATIAPMTKAYMTNATTNASRQTQVEADSLESEKTYDITVGIGLYVGAAGSVIVTTIKPDTEAYIAGTSQVNQDNALFPGGVPSNVTVEATDTVNATDLAGAAGGGIAGLGASIDVLSDDNITEAYIGTGATVSAGQDLQVLATETRNVSSTVLAFAGGFVGLAGGISIVNVGSAMSSQGQMQSGTTQTDVNGQIQASPFGSNGKVSMLPNDPNGVASSAQSNANGQVNGVSVDDSFSGSPPANLGTSASIQGSASAGGSITVQATDNSTIQTVSGSGAGGLVSAGAAVAIANISPNTQAYIAGTGTVSAGGTIAVQATFNLNPGGQSVALAFAGSGGFVTVNGAVIAVTDDSTQSAYIGGNTQVTRAQAVTVSAQSTRPLTVTTGQIAAGAVAAGGAVAIVNAGGSTEAYVTDAAQIGEQAGMSVGSLSVNANATTIVNVTTVAVSVGGVAGSVNDAEAKIENQTIEAYIAGSAQVKTTGDIDVEAVSTASANAQTVGVALAVAGSVDVSLSTATITPTVNAYIGGTANVNAGGNLTVETLHNVDANDNPDGNMAQADSSASAGALIAGITAGAATATASAHLSTYVDTNATIQAHGNITLESLTNDQAGSQMTGVGAGFLGVGCGASSSTTSGSANSQMNGTVTGGQTLTVTANSLDNATSTSYGFTGGFVSVDGASADSAGSPTVNASVGGGVTVSGLATVQATTDKSVTASVTGAAVGGVAIAGMMATAHTGGPTTAQVNGGMQAGALTVAATNTENDPNIANNAGAHVMVGSVGAITVSGAEASSDAEGTVAASIGPAANLTVTGAVSVTGTATGATEADIGGAAAGLGAVTATSATATVDNGSGAFTQAFVDGNVTSNSLSVTANNTKNASATSNMTQIGLIASGAGATNNASVGPTNSGTPYVNGQNGPLLTGGTVEAFIGTEAGSAPSGNPTTLNITGKLMVQAHSQTNATTNVSVGSGGFINGQNGQANAVSNVTTRAYLGDGTSLGSGVIVKNAGEIDVTATSNDLASSTASTNGGGFANVQSNATNAWVTPTIEAYFGQDVSANVSGNVDIEATSSDAEGHASANFVGGGAVQVGVANANETDSPTVDGFIGRFSSITAGGNVTVKSTATAVNQVNDQIGSVQTNNSSITAPSLSSVQTGDSVVYGYGSSTTPIQSNGASLDDDRSFQAIVVGSNTVQLGAIFNSQQVDASNTSNANQSGVDPNLNVIQISTPALFETGDEVQYDDMGNPTIGGLTQGHTYFVRALTPSTIKLYTTEAAAEAQPDAFVPSSAISINRNASNKITSTPIQNPSGMFHNNEAVSYGAPAAPDIGLQDASGNSTGQLQNGHTYYVVKASASQFQLAATPGGTPLFLNPSGTSGQHELFPDGVALSPSSGTHDLHITFSSAGQPGGEIQPASLPVSSGGTGQSTSSASGGAIGIGAVSKPTAVTSANPNVEAYVAAQLLTAGGNVTIATEAMGDTTSQANNSGGGVVAVGDISEETLFNSSSQAFVGTMNGSTVDGSGVTIDAQGEFTLSSDTQLTTNVSGRAVNGGGFSDVHNDCTAGANSATDSIVGQNAQVSAGSVNLLATGSNFGVTCSPRAISAGLSGAAEANANSDIDATTQVQIGSGSTVEGAQGVDMRALNENYNSGGLSANASVYAIGIGGHSNNNNNNYFQTFVQSDTGATVIAGPRPAGTPLQYLPGVFPYLALYVDAQDSNISTGADQDHNRPPEDQNVIWNANVTLLSTSPDLVIDPNGFVTTDNFVTVTDGANGPTRTVGGPAITSGTAVVTNIYDHVGQAYFVGAGGNNNDGVENNTDSAPPSGSNDPLFTFDYSAPSVTIINQSANNLQIDSINSIDPKNASSPKISADVQIDSPNYPTNQSLVQAGNFQPVPVGFNVAFVFPPTLVDIENQQQPGGGQAPSNIILTGTIQNPVGSTIIKNQRGNINATNGLAVVWTNTMDIEATGGVGAAPQSPDPIYLQLIESQASGAIQPIQLTAIATSGSLDLDITARRRDSNSGTLTVNVQKISAGQNINVSLEESQQDQGATIPSVATVGAQKFNSPSTAVRYAQYQSFFYPDSPGPAPDPGVFVNLPAAKPIATTQYQFGYTTNGVPGTNAGLTAGGNIIVEAAHSTPGDPAINILGTTYLTGASGFIDATTNGSISYLEVGGGPMRIGTLSSTNSSVVLTNEDLVAPGEDLDVVKNNQGNGLISGATTVVLNVGDDLNTYGNKSSTGSMLTAGTKLAINVDYSPSVDVDPSSGSTVNISGLVSSPVTFINGGNHDDVINLNYTHGINQIGTSVVSARKLLTAIVDVNGGAGQDSLKVDDSAYKAGDSGVMTGSEINGLGMGGDGVHYVNIRKNLEIDLGSNQPPKIAIAALPGTNPNNFTVLATVCPTTVKGGAGTDNLVVGAAIATVTNVKEDYNLNGADTSIPLNAAHNGMVPADAGDLNRIKGAFTFIGNGGSDTVEANDLFSADGQGGFSPITANSAHDPAYGYDYIVTPTSVQNDPSTIPVPTGTYTPPARTFAGITCNATGKSAQDTVTFLRLDGTNLTNRFMVTPSQTATYLINGELPNTSKRKDGGDNLVLNATGLANPGSATEKLYTTPNTFPDMPNTAAVKAVDAAELAMKTGNGVWTFVASKKTYAQPVYFLSIEQVHNLVKPKVSVNPVNITYNAALADTQLGGTATAVVSGQTVTVGGIYTYTTADGTVLNAGNGQIESVTFTPTDSNDYATVQTTVIVNVAKAKPLVQVQDSGGPYTGAPYPATPSATGISGSPVNGTFSLSYTDSQGNSSSNAPSASGTYQVTAAFTSSDPDYMNGSASTSFTIGATSPTIMVSDPGGTYNGQPFPPTATATGTGGVTVSGSFSFSYTNLHTGLSFSGAPADAGTYRVTATFTSTDPGYGNGSASNVFTISPAGPTITVTDGGGTYTAQPFPATATVTGVGGVTVNGNLSFTYTDSHGNSSSAAPSAAGTYQVTATFTSSDRDYSDGSNSKSFTISPASPTVNVSDAGGPDNGSSYPATPTATGVGGATVSGNFSLTYTDSHGNSSSNAPSAAGTYQVTAAFTSSDPNYGNGSASTSFTISQPPMAANDGYTDTAGGILTVTAVNGVLKNDQGNGLTVLGAVTQPGNGSLTLNADGSFTYTPNAGFSGTDSFTYDDKDSSGQTSSTATVTITVTPVAVNDTYTVAAGNTLTVTAVNGVLENDQGDGLSVLDVVTQPSNGSVTPNSDGSFTYVPNAGFIGTDTFTYDDQDSNGQTSNTATVTVNVIGPPTANNDSYSDGAGNPLVVSAANGVLENDQGDGLSVLDVVTQPSNGSVAPNSDGSFTYIPNAGFSGTDTFSYEDSDILGQTSNTATVTITVTPIAVNDTYTVATGNPLTVSAANGVLENDQGSSLTVLEETQPNNGSVTLNTDGSFTYVPNAGFIGTDTFTYDDQDSNGQASNTATVTINVIGPPTANNDSYTDGAGNPLVVSAANGVLENDQGDGLSVLDVVTQPGNGSVTPNSDGSFTYIPNAGFSGTDTFSYEDSDILGQTSNTAIVTITVTPVAANDTYTIDTGTTLTVSAFNGVLQNDQGSGLTVLGVVTNPSNGSVTLNTDGSFTYVPNAGFTGNDTFTYNDQDSNGLTSNTAAVTVSVIGPPTANNDSYTEGAGNPLVVSAADGVLQNDQGAGLSVLGVVTQPSNGSVTLNSDGSFTYFPNFGFSGTDTFTYDDIDVTGQVSNTATVTIALTPVAVNDFYTIDTGNTLTLFAFNGVLSNDQGSGLTVSQVVSFPSNGSVALNADGSFTYIPNAGFIGADAFTYDDVDSNGLTSNTATVTINVNARPVAFNDSYAAIAGSTLTVFAFSGVLSNDQGTGLSVVGAVTQPSDGSLTLNADGSFTYTPNAGFSGADVFTYYDRDITGQTSNTATVTIAVTPVAVNDSYTVDAGSTLAVTAANGVLHNDLGSGLTVLEVVNSPSNGSVTLNSDGSFTYIPNSGFSGIDALTYEDRDSSGQASNTATVTINVGLATPTITVSDAGGPYKAGTYPATATATDAGGATVSGSFSFTYTDSPGNSSSNAPTEAGNYTVTASFTSSEAGYGNNSGSISFTISPASPTITVTDGGGTYDAHSFPATATATGIGGVALSGNVSLSYIDSHGNTSSNAPTEAGTYTATATFTSNANDYSNGSGSLVFTISKASPTITVTDDGGTYDAQSFPASATAKGIGGVPLSGNFTFTYTDSHGNSSSSAPTEAGTYTVTATFTSSANDYSDGSNSLSLTIAKASPTITVSDNGGTYDAQSFPASATAKGIGGITVSGSFSFTYTDSHGNSSSTAPTAAGSYTVTATFTSKAADYSNGSVKSSFTIDQAKPSISTPTSSANPVFAGSTVTFTVTVQAPLGGTPQGTVTFYENGKTALGTVSLKTVNGKQQATLATSQLSSGTDSITAVYSDTVDGNFTGVTSAAFTQTVETIT